MPLLETSLGQHAEAVAEHRRRESLPPDLAPQQSGGIEVHLGGRQRAVGFGDSIQHIAVGKFTQRLFEQHSKACQVFL
jgi:hypothetical protein